MNIGTNFGSRVNCFAWGDLVWTADFDGGLGVYDNFNGTSAASAIIAGAALVVQTLAETNAGWVPEVFYMLDDSYRLFRHWYGVDLAKAPSEYATQHLYFGIVRDPVALRMRDLLPMDRIMWGSDFPHSVTSFPETRRWLDEIFAGVPDAMRRQVLVETPCAFWGLDADAALTPTP